MKHHYIPVFYLKRWAGADGKSCVYSAPFKGKVIARRVHPSGTGYSIDVYKLPGLTEDKAQSFEKTFLSPVDSAAADALRKIYGEVSGDWTLAEKSSWTRFVTSLLFRDPDSVDLLTKRMRTDYFKTDAESEARYAERRLPDQPLTLKEFLLKHATQDYVDRGSLGILAKIIDLEETGSKINSMDWNTLNFDESCQPLMTSDNPVVLTNGIGKKDAFIILPIGPRKAFIATNCKSTLTQVTRHPGNLAKSLNKTVVSYARKSVWSKNDSSIAFVQRNMNTLKASSMIEKIALMSERLGK